MKPSSHSYSLRSDSAYFSPSIKPLYALCVLVVLLAGISPTFIVSPAARAHPGPDMGSLMSTAANTRDANQNPFQSAQQFRASSALEQHEVQRATPDDRRNNRRREDNRRERDESFDPRHLRWVSPIVRIALFLLAPLAVLVVIFFRRRRNKKHGVMQPEYYPGQYPPTSGQAPFATAQYSPSPVQFPSASGQFSSAPGQYPAQQGQYPPAPPAGQYPPQGHYPPVQGQYPQAPGQYPPQQWPQG